MKGYLRYVDDIYLLDNDKQRLWALRDVVAKFRGHNTKFRHNRVSCPGTRSEV